MAKLVRHGAEKAQFGFRLGNCEAYVKDDRVHQGTWKILCIVKTTSKTKKLSLKTKEQQTSAGNTAPEAVKAENEIRARERQVEKDEDECI